MNFSQWSRFAVISLVVATCGQGKIARAQEVNCYEIERRELFTQATANDYVCFSLQDDTGEYAVRTPYEFEPGALPGATRSFAVPANTLHPGSRYWANVIFVKVISAAKDPHTGVRSGIAFLHKTGFYVHPIPPP